MPHAHPPPLPCLRGMGMKGMRLTTETWHGTASGYKIKRCRCAECKAVRVAYDTAYYAKNRDKILARKTRTYDADAARQYRERKRAQGRDVLWQYGITRNQYEALLAAQDFLCAVCATPFGDKTPHVDHDHDCCSGIRSCGVCVRGLLCGRCNRGIGMFLDDPKRLESASAYLRGAKR